VSGQPPYGQQPTYGPPGHAAVAPPPNRPARRKRKTPLIVGIGIGVLVLALVAGFVGTVLLRDTKGDMALAYFKAIQEGDAAKAMSYAADPINDTSLLTDAVLKKSAELAPITDVRVKRTSSDTVTLTMDVGGAEEQVQYDVVQREGQWKMVQAVKTFRLSTGDLQGVTPILNGAKPSNPESITIFPGTYQMGTGSPYLRWAQPEQVFLHGIPSHDPIFGLEMTDDAKKAAGTALQELLTKCVASTDLAPADCPFKMTPPSGVTVDKGSVKWAIVGTPTWEPGAAGPLLKATLSYSLRLQFDYKSNGQSGHYDKTNDMTVTAIADMSKDPITFTYEA